MHSKYLPVCTEQDCMSGKNRRCVCSVGTVADALRTVSCIKAYTRTAAAGAGATRAHMLNRSAWMFHSILLDDFDQEGPNYAGSKHKGDAHTACWL